TKVLFSNMDEKSVEYILPLASELRKKGINCEVYPDTTKLKKQFDYAEKSAIPYFVIVGENEVNNGTVNLKNLLTGEQLTMAKEDLAKKF
ncbi:MAG: His/Gly/Thr/Pro-type tRNA ligase C-terminal domain-containing protein, partial [Candidatus Egerieousia sp.]